MEVVLSVMCYKCKVRMVYKRYNSLCLPCIRGVADDIKAQIKIHGPIEGEDK